MIIDGIEAFSDHDIRFLCRIMRDTEYKIKYIVISTPDPALRFFHHDHCKDGRNFQLYFVRPLTYNEARNYLTSSECGMTQEQACQAYGLFGGDLSELQKVCNYNGKDIYTRLQQFNNRWMENLEYEEFVDLDSEMHTLIMALAESEDNDIDCKPYKDLWRLVRSKYSEIITMNYYHRCGFTNHMFKYFFALRYKKTNEIEIKDKIVSKCQEKPKGATPSVNNVTAEGNDSESSCSGQ